MEQHPWVTDVEVELARLRKEKDEAMEQAQEYAGAFQTGNQNKGDDARVNNPRRFTIYAGADIECGGVLLLLPAKG